MDHYLLLVGQETLLFCRQNTFAITVTANIKESDVSDIEYCLVQIERPIQQRSEIHFLVVYFLDTCLRAIEEQYPQEDNYTTKYYTVFQFKSGESAAHLEMKITGQDSNSHCIIALKPNPPRVRVQQYYSMHLPIACMDSI